MNARIHNAPPPRTKALHAYAFERRESLAAFPTHIAPGSRSTRRRDRKHLGVPRKLGLGECVRQRARGRPGGDLARHRSIRAGDPSLAPDALTALHPSARSRRCRSPVIAVRASARVFRIVQTLNHQPFAGSVLT